MEEIWKDITGYEGLYQVSNLGNVRSLNYNNTGKPRNLKIKINKYGFAEVKLSKKNKTRDFMVARLVAKSFIPNPNNKPQVMHISKDGTDNSVDNLKWAYKSEIKFHMYKKGSRKIGKPSKNIISYKGKRYKSYKDMALDNNIDYKNFNKRMSRGWELEECLEVPVSIDNCGGKPFYYKYEGKLMTLEELSKINNIDVKVIRKRLYRKWNINEAVEIPNLKNYKGGKNNEN